jgi:signal transduction histidine kinase
MPEAQSTAPPAATPSPPPLDRVSILVVDDNPAKALALETALSSLGQEIVKASSGREALRQMLDREFATVILDVNMPGMDGFETAQLIRGRPRSAHTPIIFVSAINLADTDVLRGYALGAVDYILAPVIPEILLAKVSVFVELHRKTEEARRHAAQLEERTRELQQSQNQLRLAERMAALGTLCAGLGHDMGNLLLPIQARIESLDTTSLTPDVSDALSSISTCVSYLRKLSSGLRMLSMESPGDGADHLTDIVHWWPDAEPMLRNVLPPGVQLSRDFEDSLPPVKLARHLLTQVVFNLVQNASDILRPRGKGHVTVEVRRNGEGITLCVVDDGPGMSEQVRQRCLEPFFTTKPRGLSTGLGLALIHSVVQKAGGQVQIESEPGKGSRFTCTLPAGEHSSSQVEAKAAIVNIDDGRRRSLVVSLLSLRGTRVLDSEDFESATIWVTDPGVPGFETRCRAFLRSKPGRRVVVMGSQQSYLDAGIVCLPRDASPAQLRMALWA